jgi:hypothetical protein
MSVSHFAAAIDVEELHAVASTPLFVTKVMMPAVLFYRAKVPRAPISHRK